MSFLAQRALVIGGSRGLGEVTAKLLAAGGASVDLTYHGGRDDAQQVVEQINSAGGTARALQYDVLSSNQQSIDEFLPQTDGQVVGNNGWTHLYYFASPHIESNTSGFWDTELYRRFSDFFVSGFARTVGNALAGHDDRPLQVVYPSTSFLDEHEAGFAEYVTAKAAGEQLALELSHNHAKVLVACPRLVRMRTDQTNSITPVQAADPVPEMLACLRNVALMTAVE